jgi:hypothetical protein
MTEFFSFASRKSFPVTITEKPVFGDSPDFHASADGRWVAWCQLDRYESDLMLVDNFR